MTANCDKCFKEKKMCSHLKNEGVKHVRGKRNIPDRKSSVHGGCEKERSWENRASESGAWSQGRATKGKMGVVGRRHEI